MNDVDAGANVFSFYHAAREAMAFLAWCARRDIDSAMQCPDLAMSALSDIANQFGCILRRVDVDESSLEIEYTGTIIGEHRCRLTWDLSTNFYCFERIESPW